MYRHLKDILILVLFYFGITCYLVPVALAVPEVADTDLVNTIINSSESANSDTGATSSSLTIKQVTIAKTDAPGIEQPVAKTAIQMPIATGSNSVSHLNPGRLGFSNWGYRYVYSNYPEDIKGTSVNLNSYNIQRDLDPKTGYSMEYYYQNTSGKNVQIGIAARNTGAHPIKLYVAYPVCTTWSSGSACGARLCAVILMQHLAALDDPTWTVWQYTIPAGESCWINNGGSLQPVTIGNQTFICGRLLTWSDDSGARVRCGHCAVGTSAASFFNLPRDMTVPHPSCGQISGNFDYDGKLLSYCSNDSDNYLLSEWRIPLINLSEYEEARGPAQDPEGSGYRGYGWYPSKLGGNYGIDYVIPIQARGQQLKITPSTRVASLVIKTPDRGWSILETASGRPWYIPITSDNFEFHYVLPASNKGNVKIELVP